MQSRRPAPTLGLRPAHMKSERSRRAALLSPRKKWASIEGSGIKIQDAEAL